MLFGPSKQVFNIGISEWLVVVSFDLVSECLKCALVPADGSVGKSNKLVVEEGEENK